MSDQPEESRFGDDRLRAQDPSAAAGVSTPLTPEPRARSVTPASLVVLAFFLAVVGAHLYRNGTAPEGSFAEQAFFIHYALIPAIAGQNPIALLSHMFVHGGWLHLGLNVAFYLMLGLVVARRLGADLAAAAGMLFITVFSGLGGAAAVLMINPNSTDAVVGFSGAVCGIAAAFLLSQHQDWRRSLADRRVRASAFWFLMMNVVAAWVATASGAVAISWEAHLGGFIAGGLAWVWAAPRPKPPSPTLHRGPWAG